MAEIVLSEEVVLDSSGVERLEDVDEVEIIFDTVNLLGGLERCPKLRSLTLIDTRLARLEAAPLLPVSRTLLRLCITEQSMLRSLPRLELPMLRDLLLHKNGLETLGGRPFDGCPRVQRLWLQCNRLDRLEGLDALGDLRELWVQSNELMTVHGVESLGTLQVLNVGGNPIGDLRETHRLRHLENLRSLAFEDAHFGSCPVCATEGYRSFVVASLPRLRALDGDEVVDEDREVAAEELSSRALQFAKAAEALQREHEEAVAALVGRRERAAKEAKRGRERLEEAFARLEEAVKMGQDKVLGEERRLREARGQHVDTLRAEMERIVKAHSTWCANRDEVERQSTEREQGLLRWKAGATSFAARTMQECASAQLVVHEVGVHTPDARSLTGALGDAVLPLRCLRVARKTDKHTVPREHRLWILAGPKVAAALAASSSSYSSVKALASLRLATLVAAARRAQSDLWDAEAGERIDVDTSEVDREDADDRIDSSWGVRGVVSGCLLQCSLSSRPSDLAEDAVVPLSTILERLASSPSDLFPEILLAFQLPLSSPSAILPSPPESIEPATPPDDLRVSDEKDPTSAANPRKMNEAVTTALKDLLRETGSYTQGTVGATVERVTADVDASPAAVLHTCLAGISTAVAKHARTVWADVDPRAAEQLTEADEEYARLSAEIVRLRAAISDAKRKQEEGLRLAREDALGRDEEE